MNMTIFWLWISESSELHKDASVTALLGTLLGFLGTKPFKISMSDLSLEVQVLETMNTEYKRRQLLTTDRRNKKQFYWLLKSVLFKVLHVNISSLK